MNSSSFSKNQYPQKQTNPVNDIKNALRRRLIIAGGIMSVSPLASGSPHPITGTRALSKVYLTIPLILEKVYLNPENKSTFYLENASEEHMQMLMEHINALSANNINVSNLRIAGYEGLTIGDIVKMKNLPTRNVFSLMLLAIQDHLKKLK
jgi:hypothetical protein